MDCYNIIYLPCMAMESCTHIYTCMDRLSEEFGVDMGLRHGCVLSPLLFSLYINGVMTKLHDGKCGVRCGGDMVPGLPFADKW